MIMSPKPNGASARVHMEKHENEIFVIGMCLGYVVCYACCHERAHERKTASKFSEVFSPCGDSHAKPFQIRVRFDHIWILYVCVVVRTRCNRLTDNR